MKPDQPRNLARWVALLGAAAAALLVTACGGGNADDTAVAATPNPTPGATAQITGQAATGAAIANATVTAVNASGQRATTTTAADGRYTITLSEGAPYLLNVTDGSGRVWYSYAQAAGVANLTPLTTLALAQAWGGRPLAELFSTWNGSRLTAQQVLDAARTVNANLAAVMQARGVASASANIFTDSFSANGQGLDAVLDAMRVAFSCAGSTCTPSIATPAGAVLVTWNGSISVAGITLSWGGGSSGGSSVGLGACTATPVAGSYSMVVQTTITGLGSVPVPEVCVDGLPARPASQADFCGGSLASGQLPNGVAVLSCSYDGSVGTIAARITTPITIDYTIKYSFVQR